MNNILESQQIRDLGNLELLAKQVVEGFIIGLHKSPFHGFSVEFAEHRLYNPGESTKNMDWKVYARTDTEAQRKAIEKVYPDIINHNKMPDWNRDKELLSWLSNLK